MKCYVAPILAVALLIGIIIYTLVSRREKYKDPLFMNREKMVHDWYPRSNGSIYGTCENYWVDGEIQDNTFLGLRPYNKIYYPGGIYYGRTKQSNKCHNLFSGVTYLDTVL
jgi:hypothetical protein